MTTQTDDLKLIRVTLKRARSIASMYHRGGLDDLYQTTKLSLEALSRLEEALKCGLSSDKNSTPS